MKRFYSFIVLFYSITLSGQGGQWTWMHGDTSANAAGVYGSKGIISFANKPPGRYEAAEWTDVQGNFWLYGGTCQNGFYNDMWKYNTSLNAWTWVSGTMKLDTFGIYGTKGVPSTTNCPGSRGFGILTWVDNNGNFWMFGGYGFTDSASSAGYLNDLWKYNPLTNEWTWMGGPKKTFDHGSYGVKGVPSATNLPRYRGETNATWTDANNNLWLFGGQSDGWGNDLWRYSITNNTWTWMHGDTTNAWNAVIPGVYGTLGVTNPLNVPGGRRAYAKWQDQANKFYLFGGAGYDANGVQGDLNDIWRYDPSLNEWTWIGGGKFVLESATMDSLCEEGADEPSGRMENRAAWKTGCYLVSFGGYNTQGDYNDLWAFNLNTKKWKWLSGDVMPSQAGIYGVKLVASPLNKPGSRTGSNGWTDVSGNFWLFGGGVYRNDMWKFTPDPFCLSCSDALSVEEYSEGSFLSSISPNPFGEVATLRYSINKTPVTVSIFNHFGSKVRQYSNLYADHLTIKKEDLQDGIYYLRVFYSDGKNTAIKIVIQN